MIWKCQKSEKKTFTDFSEDSKMIFRSLDKRREWEDSQRADYYDHFLWMKKHDALHVSTLFITGKSREISNLKQK